MGLSETGEPLEYTFDQEYALDNLTVEFLNVAHPFLQGAIHALRKEYRLNREVLSCTLASSALPPGRYLVFLYRFATSETRTAGIRHVQDRVLTFDLAAGTGTWGSRQSLFDEMITGAEPGTRAENVADVAAQLKDRLREPVQQMATSLLDEQKQQDNAASNSRRISLMRQTDGQTARIRKDLAYIHDPRIRDARLQEIRDLERNRDSRLQQLEQVDLRISARCTGIIHIENKESQ